MIGINRLTIRRSIWTIDDNFATSRIARITSRVGYELVPPLIRQMIFRPRKSLTNVRYLAKTTTSRSCSRSTKSCQFYLSSQRAPKHYFAPLIMASLCSLCSSISFLDLPPHPCSLAGHHIPFKVDSVLLPYLTKPFITPEGKKQALPVGSLGLAHHPPLLDLQTAAKNCDICALIEQSVDSVRATLELAKQDKFYAAYDKTGPPIWEFWMSKRKDGEDGFSVWIWRQRVHKRTWWELWDSV